MNYHSAYSAGWMVGLEVSLLGSIWDRGLRVCFGQDKIDATPTRYKARPCVQSLPFDLRT